MHYAVDFCTETSVSRNDLRVLYLIWFEYTKKHCHTLYLFIFRVVLFRRDGGLYGCAVPMAYTLTLIRAW